DLDVQVLEVVDPDPPRTDSVHGRPVETTIFPRGCGTVNRRFRTSSGKVQDLPLACKKTAMFSWKPSPTIHLERSSHNSDDWHQPCKFWGRDDCLRGGAAQAFRPHSVAASDRRRDRGARARVRGVVLAFLRPGTR